MKETLKIQFYEIQLNSRVIVLMLLPFSILLKVKCLVVINESVKQKPAFVFAHVKNLLPLFAIVEHGYVLILF